MSISHKYKHFSSFEAGNRVSDQLQMYEKYNGNSSAGQRSTLGALRYSI